MNLLSFTPPDRLVDSRNRPYFLWDSDLTLEEFRERLVSEDDAVRAYFIGKLMRQARPDDVFLFVRLSEISRLWPTLWRHLGRTRAFWTWCLEGWGAIPRA